MPVYLSMAVKLGVGWMPNFAPWIKKAEYPTREMEVPSFQIDQIGSDFQRFSVLRGQDANSPKFMQLAKTDEELPLVIIRVYRSDEGSPLLLTYTFERVWVEDYSSTLQEGRNLETISFLSAELRIIRRSRDAGALDMHARLHGITSAA